MVLACRLLMRATARLLAGQQAAWARGMQAEVAALGHGREALAFAWGCFQAALGCALAAPLARIAQPATAGVLAGALAVVVGCLFMRHAGAPRPYVAMNALSLLFALATYGLLPRRRLRHDGLLRGRLVCVAGAVLLGASLAGAPAGEVGWLRLGPVRLQLLWLLLPALLVASEVGPARAARRWATAGVLMACGALALQADALLAAVAAAFFGLRAWQQGRRAPACLALVPLAVALHAAPSWPAAQAAQAAQAAPFVDRVLQHGFQQHPALGAALAFALVLLLVPAWLHRRAREHAGLWGLLVLLSLPGWLPSPLVGFGGSFIVGYWLSLAVLPAAPAADGGPASTGAAPGPEARAARPPPPAPPWPRTGLA
jgi:hypothetical protein